MATKLGEGTHVADLRRAFGGDVIGPEDPSYERSRRVWNGSIDRRPALIARCLKPADIARALAFGEDSGLTVAVRGGGHSFPGFSTVDDGLVIDLGPMKRIRIEAEARSVRAQAGVLLGELDRATQPYSLAVPLGSVTHTGIAGLTLGGGFGWIMRKHGLTIDSLLSVELITADGDPVHADETQNAELFWAIRGGGGNFGIITEFENPLSGVGPMVLSGLLLWTLEDGPEMARFYRDWAQDAPRDLTTALIVRRAPALDLIPPALHGRHVVAVACCWAGPHDVGESVIAPMRRFGAPIADLVEPRSFIEHQALLDASFPPGIWVYSKACDVTSLSDGVLDAMLVQGARMRSGRSGIIAWQLGGAVADIGAEETAFSSARSGYLVDILGGTDSAHGFESERDWARDTWDALAPYRTGAYVNWLMDEGEARVRETYGEARYRRLQAVKSRHDPRNVFRLNQNVLPATPS